MSDGPRYPMPITLRDTTEYAIEKVTDTRHNVRRLVARAYAAGFQDAEAYGIYAAHNDRRAGETP